MALHEEVNLGSVWGSVCLGSVVIADLAQGLAQDRAAAARWWIVTSAWCVVVETHRGRICE
jgi:hypothetical protein